MSSPMPAEPVASEVLDAVFSALSHEARRRVLIILHARGGEMTAGEINDRFRHSWPTTSRHLGVLEDAGIVEVGKKGRHRLYSLKRTDLARAAGWLDSWVSEDEGKADRKEWANLSYARMRNAIPPGDKEGSKEGSKED